MNPSLIFSKNKTLKRKNDSKQADPRPAPPPPAGELPEPKTKELYKERAARHHAQIAKFTKYRDSDHDAAAQLLRDADVRVKV
ncbi:hypothetical protein N5P37_010347 [Trichoderma harzianum]|nr:hypothetical protein N5P37_010347 [Trichoderma harzianum]